MIEDIVLKRVLQKAESTDDRGQTVAPKNRGQKYWERSTVGRAKVPLACTRCYNWFYRVNCNGSGIVHLCASVGIQLERTAFDVAGPFPYSETRNKYIEVLIA